MQHSKLKTIAQREVTRFSRTEYKQSKKKKYKNIKNNNNNNNKTSLKHDFKNNV